MTVADYMSVPLCKPLTLRTALIKWGFSMGMTCPHGDIRHYLETFLMVLCVGVRCYWYPLGQGQGCCLTSYSAQNSLSQKIGLVPKINSTEVIFVVFCFALLHIRKLKPKGINRLPVVTQHVSDRVGVQNISVSVRRCGLVCTVGHKTWDALNTPHQTPCMVPPHLQEPSSSWLYHSL